MKYKIVKETKRRWWGKQYTVYVLYDETGKYITEGEEVAKVVYVKKILMRIDDAYR